MATSSGWLIRCALALTVSLATGCSLKRLTVDQTAEVMKDAARAFNEESDLELARDAAPGQLKMADGFLAVSPKNADLLEILAQGYASFAFGFVEDELEALGDRDPERARVLTARATGMYARAMEFGLRLLDQEDRKLRRALDGDAQSLERAVARLDRDAVPGLFWTGFGLAGQINLNRDKMELIGQLGKVGVLMARVVALDERYYNGGAHLALGIFYSTMAPAMGGNPVEARKHFDRAAELNEQKFLLVPTMMARFYAVTVQDRALFESLLRKVLDAPADLSAAQRLPNELARVRARRYLGLADELFI